MILHYFVEGETERKLIETIKNKYLYSGKIKIINTIQNKVPNSILRTLERETVVVLVFDTDVEKIDILDENIRLIMSSNNVKDVICIPQIKNLEDELIYSTNINKIVDLLESRSDKDFKKFAPIKPAAPVIRYVFILPLFFLNFLFYYF